MASQPNLDNSQKPETGSLELILGPMYAGKTTELIRRACRFELAGKRVLSLSFEGDDRSHCPTKITSHDHQQIDARRCRYLMDVMTEAMSYPVIAIDEVQFFDDADEFCDRLSLAGKRVMCAGLNGTFNRTPWANIGPLIAIADHITFLSAICDTPGCGDDAIFSHRHTVGTPLSAPPPQISSDSKFDGTAPSDAQQVPPTPRSNDQTVVVGGKESYAAKCRACFVSANTPGGRANSAHHVVGNDFGDDNNANEAFTL